MVVSQWYWEIHSSRANLPGTNSVVTPRKCHRTNHRESWKIIGVSSFWGCTLITPSALENRQLGRTNSANLRGDFTWSIGETFQSFGWPPLTGYLIFDVRKCEFKRDVGLRRGQMRWTARELFTPIPSIFVEFQQFWIHCPIPTYHESKPITHPTANWFASGFVQVAKEMKFRKGGILRRRLSRRK